jgi:hypothetical protein
MHDKKRGEVRKEQGRADEGSRSSTASTERLLDAVNKDQVDHRDMTKVHWKRGNTTSHVRRPLMFH